MKRRNTGTPGRTSKTPKLPALRPRYREAHKGDFGTVLVIGGSRGMIGAPSLVANAALRSGAGLVVVGCPRSIQLHVATLCPCATSIPIPEDENGQLAPYAAHSLLDSMGYFHVENGPSCVAIGPGLGRGDESFNEGIIKMLRQWSEKSRCPLVIDADALNALGAVADETPPPQGLDFYRAVLTPHHGEMCRLMPGAFDKNDNPTDVAKRCATRLSPEPGGNVVVVLKGHGTIVTDGAKSYTNDTGNPGMATGGTGDVLTGVIAGLIAQGMEMFDAAVLGVHVHGLAGDLAAKEYGEVSMIASDLLNRLPQAFRITTSASRRK